MYPHERSLVNKLSGKPFALIGVNSDRDREEIKEIVKEKNITWRSFWNGPEGTSGPISTRWNVTGWPTIYVMDADGVIRFKNVRGAALDRAITKLLAEIGHEVDLSNHDEEEAEPQKTEATSNKKEPGDDKAADDDEGGDQAADQKSADEKQDDGKQDDGKQDDGGDGR